MLLKHASKDNVTTTTERIDAAAARYFSPSGILVYTMRITAAAVITIAM
jgi:hypothetical protein